MSPLLGGTLFYHKRSMQTVASDQTRRRSSTSAASSGSSVESTNAIAGLRVDDVGRKDFYCDFAIEFGIVGQVNLTHAAGAELGADFVSAECFACGERQLSIRGRFFQALTKRRTL